MEAPTMTPEEVSVQLRQLGIRTSPDKIRAGIEQGVYPFGIVIHLATPCYEIYRKRFEQWLDENVREGNRC